MTDELRKKVQVDDGNAKEAAGFFERKERQVWEFFLKYTRNVDEGTVDPPIPRSIRDNVGFWEQLKKEVDTIFTTPALQEFFNTCMIPKMGESLVLSLNEKACLYYALQEVVDPKFLEEFTKIGEVQVTKDRRLMGFQKKNNGEGSSSKVDNGRWYSVWSEDPEADPYICDAAEDGKSAELKLRDDLYWSSKGNDAYKTTVDEDDDPVAPFTMDFFRPSSGPITPDQLPIIHVTPKDFEPVQHTAVAHVTPGNTIMQAMLEIAPVEAEDGPIYSEEPYVLGSMPVLAPEAASSSEHEKKFKAAQPTTSTLVATTPAGERAMTEVEGGSPIPPFNHRYKLKDVPAGIEGLEMKVDNAIGRIEDLEICKEEDEREYMVTCDKIYDLTEKYEIALKRIEVLEQNEAKSLLKSAKEQLTVAELHKTITASQKRIMTLEQDAKRLQEKTEKFQSQLILFEDNLSEYEKLLDGFESAKNSAPAVQLGFSVSSVSPLFDCHSEQFNISSQEGSVSSGSAIKARKDKKPKKSSQIANVATNVRAQPVAASLQTPKRGAAIVKADVGESSDEPEKKKPKKSLDTPRQTPDAPDGAASNETPNALELNRISGFLGTSQDAPCGRRNTKTPVRYGIQ